MKMITATWDHAVNSKDKLQNALTSKLSAVLIKSVNIRHKKTRTYVKPRVHKTRTYGTSPFDMLYNRYANT